MTHYPAKKSNIASQELSENWLAKSFLCFLKNAS